MLRSIHIANSQLHQSKWNRIFGKRLSEITIGIIGVGRIGSRVIRRTKPFGTPRLLVNDIDPSKAENLDFKLEWVSKQKIYSEAEIFLQKAVELMPTDPVINDHYADTLWMLNKNIQARYLWNYILNLDTAEKELKDTISKKLIFGIKKEL